MIRVLHYGMGSNLGGIETYLCNLSQTIDRERFHLDFLHTDTGRPPAFSEELTAQGSQFFRVTPRRVSPRQNRADLNRIFASEKFDILHFHVNTASYVAPVRAALRHGTRVVVHSHNAGARSVVTRTLHQVNRRVLPWDAIARVAVSGLAGRWMFGRRDFEVIPNGIDVEKFAFHPAAREQKRAELGIGPDELAVGSVGAFLPAKNHRFILDVFGELNASHPHSRLLLIGEGPLREETERTARDRGLSERIHFLGRRDDIREILWATDVLLMPSLYEGLPIVALEAQASGLPCVLSTRVTSEVLVTPICYRLALEARLSEWASALASVRSTRDRQEGAALMHAAGYTIAANTAAVAGLYTRISERV